LERTIEFWENPGVERALSDAALLARESYETGEKRVAAVLAEAASALETAGALPSGEEEWSALSEAWIREGALDLLRVVGEGRTEKPVLFLYRSDALPDSLASAGESRPAAGYLFRSRSALVSGRSELRLEGGRLLPEESRHRIESIREGARFYRQLRVYERYAKARVALQTAGVLLTAVVVAFFVARFLSRSLSRPLQALLEGTKKVRRGDLEARVERISSDEVGDLIDSFNAMTADLRRSRERLLRAERVATWGEAARRIAHEIKNSLTPITLSLHRLEKRAENLSAEERAFFEDCLEPILEEVENLKTLAAEFSQFSRLPAPKMEQVDVVQLLERVASLYKEGTEIRVQLETEPALPAARGDRELLWRAFSNLVKNAVEAMEGRGELRIRAESGEGMLVVAFSDTGPGIPPEERGRIFAPYFTTKKGGSGLGLALVERIVIDHGGAIDVERNEPRGATFRVTLPTAS